VGIHAIKNKKMNPLFIRAGSVRPFYTDGGSVGLLLVIFAGSHGGAVRPLNQPAEDDRVKHLKQHPKL
jgi:hypothetical protein